MITGIISGGQSGADVAGLKAARRLNIPTGGVMPKGFLTEDGPRPEYAERYGVVEHPSSKYPPRTYANVKRADATVYFYRISESVGMRLTRKACSELGKPFLAIHAEGDPRSTTRGLRPWLGFHRPAILNVAGGRESKSPGIGRWVEDYLVAALGSLSGIPEFETGARDEPHAAGAAPRQNG